MTKLKLDRPTADRAEFSLEGRFLGFAAAPDDSKPLNSKPRYLRLSTATGEQQIKLAKELRPLLHRSLIPGEWVVVSGFQKLDSKQGTLKLKAAQVVTKNAQASPRASSPTAKPDCILICQKSDCCKRGSRQVAQALEAELRDRGLQDQVTVKATGCMKRCKEGANLVMPDKTRYSRVRPEKASALLDKHCTSLT
jgi:NADH:ubiquinone oxidoreductase subunit E